MGGDVVRVKKPAAGHLAAVLERLDAAPARAVIVGDSGHDLAAARALGADRVIDRFAELPAALASLAAAAA